MSFTSVRDIDRVQDNLIVSSDIAHKLPCLRKYSADSEKEFSTIILFIIIDFNHALFHLGFIHGL